MGKSSETARTYSSPAPASAMKVHDRRCGYRSPYRPIHAHFDTVIHLVGHLESQEYLV